MKPIILKADEKGRVHLTVEDIEKMLNNAYNDGYADGVRSVPTQTKTDWWSGPYYHKDNIITSLL